MLRTTATTVPPSVAHLGIAVVLVLLSVAAPATAQQDEGSRIQWRDHTFYTDRPMPEMAAALTMEAVPEAEEGYYFIQFTGPVTREMKERAVAAGAELLTYVPNNAFLSRIDPADRDTVAALPAVRWVGIYQPAFRLSEGLTDLMTGEGERALQPPPDLRPELEMPPPEDALVEPPPLRLTVLTFRGADVEAVARAVRDAGGSVLSTSVNDYRGQLRVTLPAEGLAGVARTPGVMWVEEYRLPEPHNDSARGVMGVEPVWTGGGLRGMGQIIGVADTGLDSGVDDATMHDDVEGRITALFSQPVAAGSGADNAGADDGAADLDSGHGSHVAGSVLGDGSVSGGTYSGNAPEATVVFQAIEQFTDWPAVPMAPPDGYYLTGIPADLNDLFQQAYDQGARIHTNSWGADVAGAYTANSEEADQFVWDHPDMLILFSAGNEGVDGDADGVVDADSIGAPGTAKNVLTVGASENDRAAIPLTYSPSYADPINPDRIADAPAGMAAFSSRGPTDDGRIKPDVVAPGTMVASLRSSASPNTVWFTDDMESGVNGWTAGGNWAQIVTDSNSPTTSWHDSPAGDYGDNVNASLTSPLQNLSGGGLGGKTIQFWCRYDLGAGDTWFLEVSLDGVTFPGQLSFSGSQPDWELLSIGLGPFSDAANFRVRFRLQSDNDGDVGDGLFIDDVRVVEGAFGASLLSDHGLTAAGSADDQAYMLLNGTSMATPLTAGAAALVRQHYTDVEELGYVSAALLRATLINGAADVSPGQYGTGAAQEMGARPNGVEGWGRVDLETAIAPAPPAVLDHVDELGGLETGETRTHTLNVTDTGVPIVVTMVYHDFPGAGLVNNLDMTVTTPGATTLFPNGLGAADATNNVEQIVIPAADVAMGAYTVTIDAQNVPQGPQPYALVTRAGGELAERDPVDVMLVLDLSGSMLSPACPTCASKLQVLKDAVEIFVQLWTALAVDADRLGVTYFRTDVDELDVSGDVLLPVVANAPGIIGDVQGQMTVATNLTAMGGGLQSAINRLADATRPRNVILFTDGMQNVNPMVVEDLAGDLSIDDEAGRADSNVDPTVPPTELDLALDRKINTIGVGATAPFVALLSQIATDTDGVTKLTTAPDDDLRRFYVEELVDVLRDFSPQLIGYRRGTLAGPTGVETFTVGGSARRLVLKLSWRRGAEVTFRVVKDGSDVTAAGDVRSGPFYRIWAVDLPADLQGNPLAAAGDWSLQIRGTQGTVYEAAAIADEPELDYELSVGGGPYRVGDPIELAVRLSADGRPITDADRVTARVLRPRESLGTLLSVTRAPDATGPGAEPAATGGQAKFLALWQQPDFFRRLQPTDSTVELTNRGDGSYTASFDATTVPGTYRVVFSIEGDHPDVGAYQRTETLSAFVEFGRAVLDASDLRLVKGDLLSLTLRPRDRHGNYLGPDYGPRIVVTTTPGGRATRVRDLLDGSYRVALPAAPGSDPQVRVEVLGEPLYTGPLSGIGTGTGYRWAFSLHSGIDVPVGDFDRAFDGSGLLEVDVERMLRPGLSLNAVLGHYTFDPGFDVTGGTLYLRGYRPLGGGRLFAEIGPGVYDPDVVDTAFGLSAGVGADRALAAGLRGELGADYFRLFNDGTDIEFVAVKVGLRWTF